MSGIARPRLEEAGKVAAFLRRDFLVAWSYRTSLFGEWLGMLAQVAVFYILGRMVDPSRLPEYGGRHPSYLEFASVGIALMAFASLALHRIASAVRNEQLMGTLEAVLVTPTRSTTIQLGAVVYDLVYVPIRTMLFLLLVMIGFGLDFRASGVVPALLVLLVFVPFVWGLGVLSAAATLTFRRGSTAFQIGLAFLSLGSTSYVPIATLPAWLHWCAEHNPMTLAADGIRTALLAGPAWESALRPLAELGPIAVVALLVGLGAFRLALRREQRRGTLALY